MANRDATSRLRLAASQLDHFTVGDLSSFAGVPRKRAAQFLDRYRAIIAPTGARRPQIEGRALLVYRVRPECRDALAREASTFRRLADLPAAEEAAMSDIMPSIELLASQLNTLEDGAADDPERPEETASTSHLLDLLLASAARQPQRFQPHAAALADAGRRLAALQSRLPGAVAGPRDPSPAQRLLADWTEQLPSPAPTAPLTTDAFDRAVPTGRGVSVEDLLRPAALLLRHRGDWAGNDGEAAMRLVLAGFTAPGPPGSVARVAALSAAAAIVAPAASAGMGVVVDRAVDALSRPSQPNEMPARIVLSQALARLAFQPAQAGYAPSLGRSAGAACLYLISRGGIDAACLAWLTPGALLDKYADQPRLLTQLAQQAEPLQHPWYDKAPGRIIRNVACALAMSEFVNMGRVVEQLLQSESGEALLRALRHRDHRAIFLGDADADEDADVDGGLGTTATTDARFRIGDALFVVRLRPASALAVPRLGTSARGVPLLPQLQRRLRDALGVWEQFDSARRGALALPECFAAAERLDPVAA